MPDIRNFKNPISFNGETENPYFEGYLSKNDSLYMCGFDQATTEVKEAINDLDSDVWKEEFKGIDLSNVDMKIVNKYEYYDDIPEKIRKNLSQETLLVIAMKDYLCSVLEVVRDEIGVAMIDTLDPYEYESNVIGYKDGTFKNALTLMKEEEMAEEILD